MKKAGNKGEVNVYVVFKNYLGEITDEKLVATFLNRNWAIEFLKSQHEKGNYLNDTCYLDLREV